MFIAYYYPCRGILVELSDKPVIKMGKDDYYDLVRKYWLYNDDLGLITGHVGAGDERKPVINFDNYKKIIKQFDSSSDAMRYLIMEIYK